MFDPRGVFPREPLGHRRNQRHGDSDVEPEGLAPTGDLEVSPPVDDLCGRVLLFTNGLLEHGQAGGSGTQRSQGRAAANRV